MALIESIDNPLEQISGGKYGGFFDETKGFIFFLSNIIRTLTVIAGIWSFINLILAGYMYITAGDNADNVSKAWQKIYNSLIGLVIIVGSYAIAALLGFILYGDATAILSPKLYGVGTQ
jgi:hypothetical protein